MKYEMHGLETGRLIARLVLLALLLLAGQIAFAAPSGKAGLYSLQLPALRYDVPRVNVRISVAADGSESNDGSYSGSISADGRYIAFVSNADNLIADDTSPYNDIFVHDRQTGEITRVSVTSDGEEANNNSDSPTISATGRYVAFQSNATNLADNDVNGDEADVFVHDRLTGETTIHSVSSDGTPANRDAYGATMSADGRFVAFHSGATNLVPENSDPLDDIFIHDRLTGETALVSKSYDGSDLDLPSFYPSLSGDGRFVAFESQASNLVPDDTNNQTDIFVYDRVTAETTRVSVASDGTEADHFSQYAAISENGRYVTFYSRATNLVPDDTNEKWDIFVHDRETGETTRASIGSYGIEGNGHATRAAISATGRYVAFRSEANNLTDNDHNFGADIFVHDRVTRKTRLVSFTFDDNSGYGDAESPAISADGQYVVYWSDTRNIVPGDTNLQSDTFVNVPEY